MASVEVLVGDGVLVQPLHKVVRLRFGNDLAQPFPLGVVLVDKVLVVSLLRCWIVRLGLRFRGFGRFRRLRGFVCFSGLVNGVVRRVCLGPL